ncbi:hypothetical protein ABNB59_20965 [Paenibacillus larvae]|uniref:Uncharacterized protein n=3 Tax=Paenibacillus larvae TaxID=1464 RepID=V9W454_9BACL|nr:hypothetical protein [Paenibacillus larvae]AHD05791.1 hypothetical protein ERIC2_c19990 [Paenibacillus larvae subsp. larvae DSM 25430]AQR76747.1 hypothetical protein BXP28_04425 [Paenibacillus larvae subsp. larvae]AVF22377.1 hypothetical protein ERICI_02556 [Paenibacillus larvae subsp. larvae]AVG12331.1 hypothetical protein ERICII_01957 [Paenibacillus larvae subsp. larvae DSM 25430]ETK26771.1 hypothetical protein ERIC1_1c02010 [Paenibacillus larvae subsp. larvae DSM 25719]
MKPAVQEDLVSKYMLQFCYNCEKNHECTTEEHCRHCFAEQGLHEADHEQNETKRLLHMVYA